MAHKFNHLGKRVLSVLIILVILSLPLAAITAQTPPASSTELVGWFSHLHGDPQNRSETPRMRNMLVDEKNQSTELIIDQHRGMALNGKKVKIRGKKLMQAAGASSANTALQVESVEI